MVGRSVVILLFVMHAVVWSQNRSQQEGFFERQQSERTLKLPEVVSKMPPMDSPLDGSAYIVGPGDVFLITVEASEPLNIPVTVSADGVLAIPTVGEIQASGRVLNEVRVEALRKIAENYKRLGASITLSMPRKILIRVRGTAVMPGTYEAYASDRVSAVLGRFDIRRPSQPIVVLQKREDMEFLRIRHRSIAVHRIGKSMLTVDLDRYAVDGDPQWNPYLAEGDEVIAQAWDDQVPSVSIGGAVNISEPFEFREGDRVADLIGFARGLMPYARADSVVFVRTGGASSILDLRTADTLILLQAGDRLVVPSSLPANTSGSLSITGEVNLPGNYPVEIGKTRLSDILRMAGGPTSFAMLNGASLYRQGTPVVRMAEERLLALRGNITVEDAENAAIEQELRINGERVSASFADAIARPGTEADPLVWPGDRISIPRKSGTVYVFGSVRSPGHVPFTPSSSADRYVMLAGGFSENAKFGEVRVIKRASRQWLLPEETQVEEGDFVWVPKKVERDRSYELMTYAQMAGILSSLATVILVVYTISQ